jgi:hypothetical protein
MKRIRLAAIVAVLMAGGGAGLALAANPIAAQPAAPGDVVIEAMFNAAQMGERDREPEMVYLALEPAMADEIFDQLSPGKKLQVAEMYGRAAQQLREWDKAHAAFRLATREPAATSEDWDGRMHTAILAGDGADAYQAFRHLRDARRSPLTTFEGAQADRLDALLRTLPDREAHTALGREMETEGWTPPYASDDPSTLWLHYVEALLAAGDTGAANRAAARITDPMVMMAMHADRRFDGVIAANPGLQDPKSAAERYLAWAQAQAAAEPRMLSARLAVVRALNILNRPADALPILDAAHRAVATATRARPSFDDMEQRGALESWRSSVLLSLGRTEEALGIRAAEADCQCSPTSVTALARALVSAGRGAEALQWLAEAPTAGLGPEERMQHAQVSACAAAQVGDGKTLARDLAFLAEHERWAPGAHVRALVCADRLDAAQAALVRQLADPATRLGALGSLQSYADDEQAPAFTRQVEGRWAALAARPALQAEVAKVGRMNRYALQQWEF